MISNDRTRALSTFGFLFLSLSLSSVNSLAVEAQETDTRERVRFAACVDWLVNGTPLATSAMRIAARKAAPAPYQKFPLPLVLTNLGLSKWIPQTGLAVTHVASNPRLVFSEGMSSSAAEGDTQQTVPAAQTPFVSLGEGRSDLVPFAVDSGLKAYGVDPANHPNLGQFDAYLAKNWMVSLSGDARQLTGFEDQSQQLVVSHNLLTEMDREDRVKVLQESFRVLKPAGTARHSIWIPGFNKVVGRNPERFSRYESLLIDSVKSLIQEALGNSGYQVAVFLDQVQLQPEQTGLNLLIVLRRPDNSWFTVEGWTGVLF